MADIDQWVNLPKNKKLVDGEQIFSVERMGELEPKLVFTKSELGQAKVRLVPDGGNVTYTSGGNGEQERNPLHFRNEPGGQAQKAPGSTEGVAAETPLRLPAAGGNLYRLEAVDGKGNKKQSSRAVRARRAIHYQVCAVEKIFEKNPAGLKMMDRVVADAVKTLALAKHHVTMIKVGPDGAVNAGAAPKTVASAKPGAVGRNNYDAVLARAAGKIKFEVPDIGVAIVFLPDLADRQHKKFDTGKATFKLADGAGALACGLQWKLINSATEKRLRLTVTQPPSFLWHGFDEANDKANAYLESMLLSFKGAIASPIPRDGSHARVEGAPAGPYGGYRSFSVDLKDTWGELGRRLDQPVSLELKLNLLGGTCAGFSNEQNMVAIATRAHWKDTEEEIVYATLLHELGHRLGLAPSGDVADSRWARPHTPDSHADYYDQDTLADDPRAKPDEMRHVGRHCRAGAGGKATCAMYGMVQKGVKELCAACSLALRKADLTRQHPRRTTP